MLNCSQAQAKISQRLDGELPALPEDDLEAHLESCPACKNIAAADEAISRRLRKGLAIQPEALLRLQAKVLANTSSPGSENFPAIQSLPVLSRPWRNPVLTAAAALLIGMVLGTIFFWPPATDEGAIVKPHGDFTRSPADPSPRTETPSPTLVIERGRQDLTPIYSELDPPMLLRTMQEKKIFIPGALPDGRPNSRGDRELRLEIEKVNRKMYQLIHQPWQ